MKNDYTALDAAIFSAITDKPVFFHVIAKAADEEAKAFATNEAPGWCVVDRRLQALRKSGLIRYSRKPEGWVIA
jgi:hypothetical protein